MESVVLLLNVLHSLLYVSLTQFGECAGARIHLLKCAASVEEKAQLNILFGVE
jgi:hypothetical protein